MGAEQCYCVDCIPDEKTILGYVKILGNLKPIDRMFLNRIPIRSRMHNYQETAGCVPFFWSGVNSNDPAFYIPQSFINKR